jgi:hypothetical protein
MPLVLLQRAYLCYRQSFVLASSNVRFIEHCRQFLHVFVPLAAVQLQTGFSTTPLATRFAIVPESIRSRSTCAFIFGAVAPDQFDFGVQAAGLLHLLHTSMRSQFSLGLPLQLAVKSLVVSVQLRD